MNMIKIPSGKFLMGSKDWGEFERPVHETTLKEFLMDETLVTNRQFKKFVDETNYLTDAEKAGAAWSLRGSKYQMITGLNWKSFSTEERIDHPVVLVSWNDAFAYSNWVGKRLPTEAEWEYACRGGLTQKLFPWGDYFKGDESNWNKPASEIPRTTPVKTFAPNDFGLYDMVGNTWQWINDWYDPDYYQISPLVNPQGPDSGTLKVRRGASFNVIQNFRLRCANRGAYEQGNYSINIGFRCAKSL